VDPWEGRPSTGSIIAQPSGSLPNNISHSSIDSIVSRPICPRVACEAIPNLLFGSRLDDELCTVSGAIADRATEKDKFVLGECVHERRMAGPVFLFAHRYRIDPRGSLVADDDEVSHREDDKSSGLNNLSPDLADERRTH
jgi:hypothetical protein